MEPTFGNNFLLAFDYKLPPLTKEIKNILYIHSFPESLSEVAIKRIKELFPDANLFLLKNRNVRFEAVNLSDVVVMDFESAKCPEDFCSTPEGAVLKNAEIDLIFFGINQDVRPDSLNPMGIGYDNILQLICKMDLYHWTCIIDNQFCIYYPHQICTHNPHQTGLSKATSAWKVKDIELQLPWTLLSKIEKEKLFDLAQNGPGCGVIVNIGNFLGGSSIILSKGSKLENREKVYSFDIEEYPHMIEFQKLNGVDDWICFEKNDSISASRIWGKRNDPNIRLLFIDGDHSYDGCRNDIEHWYQYLIPNGIIAIHDYGNISANSKYSEIVKAVYDTIIQSDEFYEHNRVDTLFMSKKKPTK